MKESSGLFAVKVRSHIADSFERRLVRGGERMKGRVDSKRHDASGRPNTCKSRGSIMNSNIY